MKRRKKTPMDILRSLRSDLTKIQQRIRVVEQLRNRVQTVLNAEQAFIAEKALVKSIGFVETEESVRDYLVRAPARKKQGEQVRAQLNAAHKVLILKENSLRNSIDAMLRVLYPPPLVTYML